MATTTITLNDNIKKKLLALSENIRRNLLQAAGNVQRRFILEEKDLLSVLILAIQHLNKQQPTTNNAAEQKNTDQKNTEYKDKHPPEQDGLKANETNHLKQPDEKNNTMGRGGGKTENDPDLDSSEKLRKELIRILDSTSFDNDCKSHLIVDMYERFKKQTNLTREREILNSHLKNHPNVLIGGGGDGRDNDGDAEPLERQPRGESSTMRTSEQPSTSTTTPEHRKPPTNDVQATSTTPRTNPIDTWINDAVTIITSHMKKKVNIIFLDNLQFHANKLRTFLTTKGRFDKDNNRIHAPNNRFFLKRGSLYFKLKSVQSLQSFDLATVLACISLSQSKLFRFLQYRFDKVKAFSKQEKQCLTIFLNTCPISRQRIPCKTIRDLSNP